MRRAERVERASSLAGVPRRRSAEPTEGKAEPESTNESVREAGIPPSSEGDKE